MIGPLYRIATSLGGPGIRWLLMARRRRGKEDPARLDERMGIPGRARPDGPLVWVHAASVGESMAALPLVEALLDRLSGAHALVTTGTVTSAEIMSDRLPARAFHQYVPVDRLIWVRRFLDHWRPDLALWVESELWPNLVRETAARAIPMALVNGRMSPRSVRGWRRFPGLARALLAAFDPCLVQSPADAERFAVLGALDPQPVGSLKYAAAPLPADPATLEALRAAIGGRPAWLAASTHPGEEQQVAAVHERLATGRPNLLTLVVPRHAVRGSEVARIFERRGLAVRRRAEGALPDAGTDIYLGDTMGELGLFYRAAPVAFVGGSLVPHGGQNVLEPAQLGCAIVHGPHMHNFAAIVEAMDAAGGSETVSDAAELARAVDALLDDDALRARRTEAASEVAKSERDALPRTMAALEPHLAALAQPEPGRARA